MNTTVIDRLLQPPSKNEKNLFLQPCDVGAIKLLTFCAFQYKDSYTFLCIFRHDEDTFSGNHINVCSMLIVCMMFYINNLP